MQRVEACSHRQFRKRSIERIEIATTCRYESSQRLETTQRSAPCSIHRCGIRAVSVGMYGDQNVNVFHLIDVLVPDGVRLR
jgi:hypothetical protein